MELRFMKWADRSDNVLKWNSEEIIVPYISPIDKKRHRYFPDFLVTIQNKKGITTYLCEVKPLRQCKPPTNRKSKYFLTEQRTYAINQAKWMAAKKHCEKMGWTWKIITEKELKV